MTIESLTSEIKSLPREMQKEVADFVAFLKSRIKKKEPKLKQREFGFLKGKIWMSKDFDEPLEDFKDYM
jgi:hypothetical protein